MAIYSDNQFLRKYRKTIIIKDFSAYNGGLER